MEKQLFDWDSYEGDDSSKTFYNIVLKVSVGPHRLGSKFYYAHIDYEQSEITFAEDENRYKLKLSIT